MTALKRRATYPNLIAGALLCSATSLQAYSGEVLVTCGLDPQGDNFLALRSCGASNCPRLGKLGPNTYLHTLEPYAENGWREVIVLDGLADQSFSGPKGWIFEKYACPTDN
ncbi:hypothetical protein R3X27_06755 [Tropicimonas sp. TH_r6]|uniref:hypothetical protein n=1 Tax=Tropicimonas sp. TH_r6 TaxID=3082085 RepID=UPI002953078E|nr:hypothetical protein [Tropicimonas sp. TH_r6]MDV7142378.1 hypothetical protein [Tropicimonas sp. TH_r6]